MKHVVPAVIKPARTLWNEVIGFIFAVLAITFGFRAGNLYVAYSASAPAEEGTAMGRFVLAALSTLLMAYFAISSFLRARKISRS